MVPAEPGTLKQGHQLLHWQAAHCHDITPPLQVPEDLAI
jgi:hypothetical protein